MHAKVSIIDFVFINKGFFDIRGLGGLYYSVKKLPAGKDQTYFKKY